MIAIPIDCSVGGQKDRLIYIEREGDLDGGTAQRSYMFECYE